jgi:hypothetical protein
MTTRFSLSDRPPIASSYQRPGLLLDDPTATSWRVETLTQAILAQAFRGELVPTEAELARQEDCKYEPASVLLERIRAHWPAPNQVKKRNVKERHS